MEGKSDDTQVSRVYLSQEKAEQDIYIYIYIYNQVCIGKGSKDVVDDKTNNRGARMVFHTMNPINTWKRQNVVDDHDTLCRAISREYHRIATSPNKRGGGAKGKRCSRLTTTQNLWNG